MSDDGIKELIREIAAQHGVAVDRDDPILILHTATRIIVQDALRQAQQDAEQALAQHRSELELAAAKWHEDSKRTAAQFLQHVPTAIASSTGAELNKAASTALSQLEQALDRHEKALTRSTLACALAAAVAVLAAATFLWASEPKPERSDPEIAPAQLSVLSMCLSATRTGSPIREETQHAGSHRSL